MKILHSTFLFIAFCTLILTSCKDDVNEMIFKEKLSGFIQKGPFLNGTSVSVSELNKDVSQTGKVFNSQIKDNQGTFEIPNLQLSSPYVELKADGFYFNEVSGTTSTSRLILNSLADITNISSLNVNVITTLEKARVEKLVAGGLAFTEAKKKAMSEILAVFSISKDNIQSSELLDISKSGEDNAILLAISAVLQGYRSEAQLSELLANISEDVSVDGKLDGETLGTALISHAKFLNVAKIRENLTKRYQEIGSTAQIPAFERYITQFIEKTSFKAVSLFAYPEAVDGSLNVLNEKNSTFAAGFENAYKFSASIPKGTSLKIKLEYVEGGNPYLLDKGLWFYRMENGTNWKVSPYDFTKNSQTFEVIEAGIPGNLTVFFVAGENLKLRISYFENSDLVATQTRIITIN